ncbi:MAG: helix-turn-helix domain-containing protein [Simkaniaceae bacterium]
MKDYLFRKNLSVKQVAGDLSISTSYLYQLIRGERKPSLDLAQKIEALTAGEVTVAMLMGLEKKEESRTIEERLNRLEASEEKMEGRLEALEGRLSEMECRKKR